MTSRHLLLAGGGHAHMMTLAAIDQFIGSGHRVTVVGPADHHYYSGMGPGMLGGTYQPEEIRFRTRHLVEKKGGHFVRDKVARIDAEAQTVTLGSGETIAYDVASFNTGSYIPADNLKIDFDPVYTVKPIDRLFEARQALTALLREKDVQVGIIGGGPSAAELAGNIWQIGQEPDRQTPRIRIFAGRRFLERFSAGVQRRVAATLQRRGIEINTTGYAVAVTKGSVEIDSGATYPVDFVFMAMGVRPSPMFRQSGVPTGADGGLLVNRHLQSVGYANIFGGGDCITLDDRPLDKVGVYAVRQNPVLLHNLMAAMNGGELASFDSGGNYLLILNLGGGVGVLRKNRITFGGKTAFRIKDTIDRKFMKRFQAEEV